MIADDAENSAALLLLLEEETEEEEKAAARAVASVGSSDAPLALLESTSPPPPPVHAAPATAVNDDTHAHAGASAARDASHTDNERLMTAALMSPTSQQFEPAPVNESAAVWSSSRRTGRRQAPLLTVNEATPPSDAGTHAQVERAVDTQLARSSTDSDRQAKPSDPATLVTRDSTADQLRHGAQARDLTQERQQEAHSQHRPQPDDKEQLEVVKESLEVQHAQPDKAPSHTAAVEAPSAMSEPAAPVSALDVEPMASVINPTNGESSALPSSLVAAPVDVYTPHMEEKRPPHPTTTVVQSPLEPADTHTSAQNQTFMTEVHESNDPSSSHASASLPAPDPNASNVVEPSLEPRQGLTPLQVPGELADESEWIACATDAGESYYYNTQTNESRWTPPTPSNRTTGTPTPLDAPQAVQVASTDALFAAVARIDPFASALQSMLHAGADPDQVNGDGLTLLQVACQSANTHAAELLMYYGATPDGTDARGDAPPPLFIASAQNDIELIQLLLDYGAPLSATDIDGNTVLHACVASKSFEALLVLLTRVAEADVAHSVHDSSVLNQCNRDDETPLHVAIKTGSADAVRALLKYGSRTDVEDSQGRTPLVLGIMENQIECVQLLQAHASSLEHSTQERSGREHAPTDGRDPPIAETTRMAERASRFEQLQAHVARLAVSEATPALRSALDQFVDVAGQRISGLAGELEVRTIRCKLRTFFACC